MLQSSAETQPVERLLDAERTGVVEMNSARVYRILRGEILAGKLKPGERLVRRTQAKRLGVSAIPVLEALHRLEQDGLVETPAMHTARVRSLTIADVRDTMILREAIESQIARVLCQGGTREQFDELYLRADVLDEMMARLDPGLQEGVEKHLEFHLLMGKFSGAPLLLTELRRVWTRWFMLLAWVDAAMYPCRPGPHRRLIDAVASRDLLRADEAARFHVRGTPEEYEHLMKQQQKVLDKLREMNWVVSA